MDTISNTLDRDISSSDGHYIVNSEAFLNKIDNILLTPIGSVPNRIYIQPPTGLLPLNEDYGLETPRFVSDYAGDVQMGGCM
jgi:hypothetical protein